MLELLRRRSVQRNLMIVFAAAIIPGFVLFGIENQKSDVPSTAGSIGSHKVSTVRFIREYEALRRELELFYGIQSPAWMDGVNLQDLTWQRILLVRAARDQGIRVADGEVIEWIHKLPVFAGPNGQFDPERYSAILEKYYRIDARQFEESTRDFLYLRRIREKIRSQAQVSDNEVRQTFERRFAAKNLEYVALSDANLPAAAVVSDQEMRETYELFKGRMMNPESVQVRYLSLPKADAAPSDQAQIDRLLAEGGYQTGFISKDDPIPGIGVAEDLSEAFFKLQSKGERTGWVASGDKQYLFELVERKPFSPMSFEDAEGILRKELTRRKTLEALLDLARSFRDDAKTTNIAAAAQKHGLTPLRQEGFVSGAYLDKVGEIPEVDSALQNLGAGDLSDPIATSNGWLIAQVTSIGAIDESQWEKQKDSLRQELLTKREVEIFETQMEGLKANLRVNTEAMNRIFPPRTPASSTQPPAKS